MPDPDPVLLLSFRDSLKSCTKCDIHANTGGPIPWRGPLSPRFAILGEAPGRTEAQKRSPFVGDSGSILRHWLRQVGIEPAECAFLNSVACWPNRNPATPTRTEIANCRSWVHGQLEFIRPEVVVTLGTVAFHQIREGISKPKLNAIHGKPYHHPRYDFHIWSTNHPAAYLRGRNKTYEEKITSDLDALVAWDSTGRRPLEDCAICGREPYRYDEWQLPYCFLHAQHQGMLFAEDVGTTATLT